MKPFNTLTALLLCALLFVNVAVGQLENLGGSGKDNDRDGALSDGVFSPAEKQATGQSEAEAGGMKTEPEGFGAEAEDKPMEGEAFGEEHPSTDLQAEDNPTEGAFGGEQQPRDPQAEDSLLEGGAFGEEQHLSEDALSPSSDANDLHAPLEEASNYGQSEMSPGLGETWSPPAEHETAEMLESQPDLKLISQPKASMPEDHLPAAAPHTHIKEHKNADPHKKTKAKKEPTPMTLTDLDKKIVELAKKHKLPNHDSKTRKELNHLLKNLLTQKYKAKIEEVPEAKGKIANWVKKAQKEFLQQAFNHKDIDAKERDKLAQPSKDKKAAKKAAKGKKPAAKGKKPAAKGKKPAAKGGKPADKGEKKKGNNPAKKSHAAKGKQ